MSDSQIKKTQLEALIRSIVREIINEYDVTSLSSSDMKKIAASDPNFDTSTPPEDDLSSVEKARMEREAERDRKEKLKSKEEELKTAKKEMDYQKQKVDQAKRFNIPTINRDIQQLKGAKI